MSSIDLIPAEFRERRIRTRRLRGAALSGAVVIATVLAASGWLRSAAARVQSETATAQTRLSLTAQQREQLQKLDDQLGNLREEWTLLQGLRSGAAAEELFVIIDRALPDEQVWFDDWQFRRAGVLVTEAPRTVNTGYFIVVQPQPDDEDQAAWRVMTHMSINGQARDHAALSRFVRGLFAQPQIHDVKLNSTRIREYESGKVVEFDVAVVLHSDAVNAS